MKPFKLFSASAICLSLLATNAHALDVKKLKPQQIRISYQKPTNPKHQKIYELLKERRALEKFQEILSAIRLPRSLTLQTKDCDGDVNAWYDYDDYTITVCYDLLQKNFDDVPKETTPAGVTPSDALLGPVTEIFLHETGHAVFDLLEAPILGHEEDAADQFAAYILLKFNAQEARKLIGGIAYMYGRDAENALKELNFGKFADEHGQPAQRYFTYLCLAYGADPKNFAIALDQGRLPKDRADRCEAEYDQVDFAFKKTITPYVDQTVLKKVRNKSWLKGKLPSSK